MWGEVRREERTQVQCEREYSGAMRRNHTHACAGARVRGTAVISSAR